MKFYFIIISIILSLIVSKVYLTMNLIIVDDCILKVYKKNETIFKFPVEISKTTCNPEATEYYSMPLINKANYDFGEVINFNISDNWRGNGFLKIDVIINEYTIRNKHQKFWKCIDCISEDKNYIYNKDYERFDFYPGISENYGLYYNFLFQINSSNDLNYDGNEVNSNFYELKSETKILNISLFEADKEIKLMNILNNFNIKDNPDNISINYENYYFKIYFNHDLFDGKLISLNLSDLDIELNNGSEFKNSKSNGLRYILSD